MGKKGLDAYFRMELLTFPTTVVRGRFAGWQSIGIIVSSQAVPKRQGGWPDCYHILQIVRIIISILSHIYVTCSVVSRKRQRKTWSICLSTSGNRCRPWHSPNLPRFLIKPKKMYLWEAYGSKMTAYRHACHSRSGGRQLREGSREAL